MRYDPIVDGDEVKYLEDLCDRVEAALDQGLMVPDVFNDSRVFRAEMERIYSSTWIFMAHESEIPNPGDFVLRRMGLDNVIVCRDDDGVVNVLLNHCRHRGTEICHEDSGNAFAFKCPYHGWMYRNNGEWFGAPHLPDAYGNTLDPKEWSLLKAPHVDQIHGFIFASLTEDIEPLRDYLGGATFMFDALFNLHPDGMKALGPPERFIVRADWKSGAENFSGDAYHVGTAHYAATDSGLIHGDVRETSQQANGYQFENGHAFIGHRLPTWFGPPFKHWGYPEEVTSKFDWSRIDPAAKEMIETIPPTIGNIFPNFAILRFPQPAQQDGFPIAFTSIRLWQPLEPGVMELWNWTFDYACAPEWHQKAAYAAGQFGFGSGGIFEQDDTAVWEGISKVGQSVWHRKSGKRMHYHQLHPEKRAEWKGPGIQYDSIYGEVLQREFWRRWVRDMRNHANGKCAQRKLGACPSEALVQEFAK